MFLNHDGSVGAGGGGAAAVPRAVGGPLREEPDAPGPAGGLDLQHVRRTRRLRLGPGKLRLASFRNQRLHVSVIQ